MKGKKRSTKMEYEVSVWDLEGNVVRKLWHATDDDLDALEDQYGDDGAYTIVIDESREVSR